MTKQEFDQLSETQKHHSVSKALAWFCVQEAITPFSYKSLYSKEERDTIKIILGKIKDGEISLK